MLCLHGLNDSVATSDIAVRRLRWTWGSVLTWLSHGEVVGVKFDDRRKVAQPAFRMELVILSRSYTGAR
jgi:hypothetical protein